ncbi:MAG: BapA prefix-like domain-containing protein, partial [Desulfobulbaceae bacterium]|nr:BapA prefix-like domain-containing protein [Desulfobulbaceae bacterium]
MISPTILANHVDVPIDPAMTTVRASGQPTNFLSAAAEAHVKNYERTGNDLIIQFDDGRELRIDGFFTHGVDYNNLVFV